MPSSELPEYDWRDDAEFVPIDALLLFESLSPAVGPAPTAACLTPSEPYRTTQQHAAWRCSGAAPSASAAAAASVARVHPTARSSALPAAAAPSGGVAGAAPSGAGVRNRSDPPPSSAIA